MPPLERRCDLSAGRAADAGAALSSSCVPIALVVVVSFFDYDACRHHPGLHRSTTTSTCSASDVTWTLYLQHAELRADRLGAHAACIGFTVAYFLVFHVRNLLTGRSALFLLCTVPFWTSNIIRMISWIPFLGRNGICQPGADGDSASIDQPLEWLLFSDFAVVLAYVHLLHAVHDRADLQLHGAHRPVADRGGASTPAPAAGR